MKKFPWEGICAALLTILTASWTADGLKGEALFSEWFPILRDYRHIVTSLTILLFILSFLWLYRNRQAFLSVTTLSRQRCKPHASLILLLSPPNLQPEGNHYTFPTTINDRHGNIAALQGNSLRNDIEELNKIRYWNWQQILRGLQPHESKLKHIYLVGSGDSKGSFAFLDNAEILIRQYFNEATIHKADIPVDFEEFDELVDFLDKAIEKLRGFGMKEKDIVIDVTGGFKTASISGAAITLNRRVTFQYVQTLHPHEVYAYDVATVSPVSL